MKNEIERLMRDRNIPTQSKQKTLTENLKEWREDRNITEFDTIVYVENVIEELLEIFTEDKKEIKHLQSEIMDKYFNREPINILNTIDAIQDIQVFCINETELMGYDNIKCNDEVFQEINSREQDPQQFAEWQKYGASGKWQKYKHQKDWTLYKANYASCKCSK